MSPIWTSQNIITVVLVVFVLAFWALEKGIRSILGYMQESLVASTSWTSAEYDKYSRIAAAALVLKFVSILVKTTATLALALGVFKVFTDLANLVLPDRTLGLAVLMSYCGLFAVGGVVSEDIGQAIKKLLH